MIVFPIIHFLQLWFIIGPLFMLILMGHIGYWSIVLVFLGYAINIALAEPFFCKYVLPRKELSPLDKWLLN